MKFRKVLTNDQIKFINYICSNHSSLGELEVLKEILRTRRYSTRQLDTIHKVLERFNLLKDEMECGVEQSNWFNIRRYNRPTKYLG